MDFRDSAGEPMATDFIETAAPAKTVRPSSGIYPVEVDHSRDALLSDFG